MSLVDEGINFIIWEQILTGKMTFAKVGEYKGIKFIIHPKEQGHNEPHCHVEYQGSEISISLISFKVLGGNIPPQRHKLALEFMHDNIDKIKKYWGEYHEEIVA